MYQKIKYFLTLIGFSIIGPNGESCKTGALETSANDFQKGATDVFTSLGRQCVVTSFPEGVSKLIVELSGNDAWCFQDAVLELDSGEKFKFENPEKHRKGKPDQSDWIRNEKRASTAVKIGSGTGCSLNIVFFQKFSKDCHLSLASTRLLLVVEKITSQ